MASISVASVIAGTASGTAAAASTTSTTDSSTLSSDDFMNLLITQLKNQDPDSPMDTATMMTQTTQMAEMEKLSSMDTTATSSYALQQKIAASGLIGDTVSWADASTGAKTSGTVTGVDYAATTPTVTVGSTSVALSSISAVTKA